MPPDADLRAGATASAAKPAAPGEPIQGFIDRVYDRRITGWAWNSAAPDDVLEVEIQLDGTPIATVRADRLRSDLVKRGCGDGRHGFDVRLAELLPADSRERLSAAAIVPGTERRTRLPSRATKAAQAVESAVSGALPDALRAWLGDFQSVQRQLEATLTGAVRDVRAATRPPEADGASVAPSELMGRIEASQEELARQIATLEVVQARVDETLARLEGVHAAAPQDRSERWLRLAVFGLAALSGFSLLLGIWSLLG